MAVGQIEKTIAIEAETMIDEHDIELSGHSRVARRIEVVCKSDLGNCLMDGAYPLEQAAAIDLARIARLVDDAPDRLRQSHRFERR